MDMQTDIDNELTVTEGIRSPQCRRDGNIVPVLVLSSSDAGLPEACSAGATGELTRLTEGFSKMDDDREIFTPGKEEEKLVSDGEGEGDDYVSSLEDPPTPNVRPGPSGRRYEVRARMAAGRGTTSLCDGDENNVSGRSCTDEIIAVSDTNPKTCVARVSACSNDG